MKVSGVTQWDFLDTCSSAMTGNRPTGMLR
jgi:hypothetical protein